MLDFEAALARAEARAGVIPEGAAAAIAEKCDLELFDVSSLLREEAVAGTLPIPLVRALTGQVRDDARGFVHWGATSQDVIDTGMVLQVRDGLDLLVKDLLEVAAECVSLVERFRRAPMPGRTLLQHALPITFGLKAARWLALTVRRARRLDELRAETLVLQFGGAAGTLAALGSEGVRVSELLGEELGLRVPELPWHAERDAVAEVVTALGIVSGAMGKIATDVALLSQTEVGEVAEGGGGGKGGSSAMPQKRNPVDATAAIASARLTLGLIPVVLSSMVQEHERGAGGWQAEWTAVPAAFEFTASAVARVRSALRELEVDPERMRANLELTHGQIMAEALMMKLAPVVGRDEAYRVVEGVSRRARREGRELRSLVLEDEAITGLVGARELEDVFDPLGYLGSTQAFIDRVLERFREVAASSAGAT